MSYYYNGAGVIGAVLGVVTFVVVMATTVDVAGDKTTADDVIGAMCIGLSVASLLAGCVGFVYDRLPPGKHLSSYLQTIGAATSPRDARIAVCWSVPLAILPFLAPPLSVLFAVFVSVGALMTSAIWGFGSIALATVAALLTLPLRSLPVTFDDAIETALEPERSLEDPRQSSQPDANEDSRCPQCGFGYSWNGTTCGHCHYVSGEA